jgi:hypothetical protein
MVGEQLHDTAASKQAASVAAIIPTRDSIFIRRCEDGQRHLEIQRTLPAPERNGSSRRALK